MHRTRPRAHAIRHLSEQIMPPHMAMDWSSAQLWLCNRHLSVATEMHTPLEILQLESVLAHAASDVFLMRACGWKTTTISS